MIQLREFIIIIIIIIIIIQCIFNGRSVSVNMIN